MATYYERIAHAHAPGAPLVGAAEARVAVVGGGFAGLAVALGLAERGVDGVALLEGERIGHGASGRNGGFVFAGYSLGEAALLRRLGAEAARRVYRRSVDAIGILRRRIREYAIDCAPVEEGVLWANWFADPGVLQARQRLLAESFDAHWELLDREALAARVASPRYSGALWEREAMHVQPLELARGLARAAAARGVRVHEGSRVHALERAGHGWRLRTAAGQVAAEHVVLASGGYGAGLWPAIDRSVLAIATYVMVTEPLGERLAAVFPGTRAAVYDTRFAFDYYRPLGDTRLLWGGRISVRDLAPERIAWLLRDDLLQVFPQLEDVRVEDAWSGLMSYARHEMPQIASLAPGLWCAQGFGGHGIATTTVAGELLAAAIAEGDRGHEDFRAFGLVPAFKPLGYLAAQGTYWWLQWRDAFKAAFERRRR